MLIETRQAETADLIEISHGRTCALESCGKAIDHLRADARYCNKSCRREASRIRAANPDGTTPFDWRRYSAIRRRSTRTPADAGARDSNNRGRASAKAGRTTHGAQIHEHHAV